VINRCSFSGATLSGGFSSESASKRFTQSSINNVKKLELKDFEFFNLDFTDFITNEHSPGAFMFLDPPYYLGDHSKLYGNKGDMHETFDHAGLFESVRNLRGWMMTYNDCEYIRELYKEFTIMEVDWSYGMNKSKESSEIVIIGK
jgi:DNA adenine methylase